MERIARSSVHNHGVPAVDDHLRSEIDVGSFPSASYAIGTVDRLQRENALGHAVAVPVRIPAAAATLYDCASITKPLITGTLVLQAVAEVQIYWQRRMTQGVTPPPVKTSDQEVVAFVASTPGAIGYVTAVTPLPEGVRAIELAD